MANYNNITIEGAKIKYRNFSGKERDLNPAGRRNFCVILDEEFAKRLIADGWNVKEDKYDDYILQVAVSYLNYPPKIVQVTERNQTVLTENQVGLLDNAEIKNIDLVIRPYNYNVNGKSGIKAYCKTMYVTIEEEFGGKYDNLPYSDSAPEYSDGFDEQEEDIPF